MDLFFLVLIAGALWFVGFYVMNRTFFLGQARLMALVFVTGALAAVPVSLLQAMVNRPLECWGYFGLLTVFLAAFLACFLHEAGKLFSMMCITWRSARFTRGTYGLVYGATAALGYFLFLSAGTLVRFRADCGLPDAFGLGLLRGGIYLGAHILFSALLGSYLGRARFAPGNGAGILRRGLLYASLLHASFLYAALFNAAGPAILSAVIALLILLGNFRRMNLEDKARPSHGLTERPEGSAPVTWAAVNNGIALLLVLGLAFSLALLSPIAIKRVASLGISLAVPKGWIESGEVSEGGVCFSAGGGGGETAKLGVVKTSSLINTSLVNQADQVFARAVKSLKSFQSLSFGFCRIGPENAVEREYSWEGDGKGRMRARVVYLLNNINFYSIRAEAGMSLFEKQAPLLNLVCKSIRFMQ
ncbi:MAG: PrsW family glutamic-type intramembrane protease [bacterium]